MYEIYFVPFSQIAVLYICFSQCESKHYAYNNGCGDADQINNTANISSNQPQVWILMVTLISNLKVGLLQNVMFKIK